MNAGTISRTSVDIALSGTLSISHNGNPGLLANNAALVGTYMGLLLVLHSGYPG